VHQQGPGLRGGGSPWQARSRADLLGQVSWSGCDRSIASPSASMILAAAGAVRGVPTIGATATSGVLGLVERHARGGRRPGVKQV
jgi:hypothetical protein